MDIITRAEWGARPPTSRVTTSPSNREYYVVHHSGGPVNQTVRAIQDWCMDGRGFADIDYNFLVRGNTGQIYEGRGWDVVGAHTTGYNTSGVGVCIIGTDQCSDAAKVAVRWLYAQYNARCGKTLKIRGHRDLATTGTDCPGDRNYAWVHAGMPAPAGSETDMPLDQGDLDNIGTACINAVKFVLNSDAATIANLKARPWQYAGGGLPSDLPAGTSTLLYFSTLYARVAAVTAALPTLADGIDENALAQNVANNLVPILTPALAAALADDTVLTEDEAQAAAERAVRAVLGQLDATG